MIPNRQDPAERGVAAVVVAMVLVVLVTIVSGVIEIGRLGYVRSVVQAAADSGAVAAGKIAIPSDKKTTADIEAFLAKEAQKLVDANINLPAGMVTVTPVKATYTAPLTTPGGTVPATDFVELSMSATVPLRFAKVIGLPSVKLEISSKSQRPQPGPIDLVLVVDTTESMLDTPKNGTERKIFTLRTAATNLVNKLMTNRPNVQVGVVPYSSYVNYGTPTFNDKQEMVVPDWILEIKREYYSAWAKCSWQYPDKKCIILPPVECIVDGVKKQCSKQDCSPLGKQICTGGTLTYRWNGCIGARSVVEHNSPKDLKDNVTTEDYLDTIEDIDKVKYAGLSQDPARFCTSTPTILPMTNKQDDVLAKIKSLWGSGDTHIPTGLIWGWNVLDPREPYAARSVDELKKVGGKKVLLLMTDGINATSPRLTDGSYWPNGRPEISADWTDGEKSNKLTSTICENIKAKDDDDDDNDIEIYTVMFDVEENSSIEGILKSCASDESKAYKASSAAELNQAFEDIGNQLMVLKIVK